tara:strand:+ start:124 stop:615 length:492 start_codon:yes stop_codon:yes gene_type:complete
MLEKYKKLPLRNGVGIVLLNKENNVFVGKRIDNPANYWQMPQGGINENESILDAAKRELEEETGVNNDNIEIIKELNDWLIYELPNNLLGKIWKGKYRGQKQKWFIMKFLGDAADINIKTQHPEFSEWKWIEPSQLTKVAVDFKISIYKKILDEIISLKKIKF